MEEDRAQTDLGIAADIEEAQRQAELSSQPDEQETVTKQPKKRFIGRRAADAASQNASADTSSSSTAVGGEIIL